MKQKNDDLAQNELLERNETASMLKISSVTLWKWTREGRLKSYGISNKIFYKRSEVLESIKPINY
tara:strand:+ start:663 stop:857 length:195 start_codon:yes stop_codon:yes gene_type:complete